MPEATLEPQDRFSQNLLLENRLKNSGAFSVLTAILHEYLLLE
jgi:hypothetical protein